MSLMTAWGAGREYRVMALAYNGHRYDEEFGEREFDAVLGLSRIAKWVEGQQDLQGATVHFQIRDPGGDWVTLVDVEVAYKPFEVLHLTMSDLGV